MSSEFQNLIKTKSIGSITPNQILDAGSSIFFDVQTSPDINAINKAIAAYRNIHAPFSGQPIPLSGVIVSRNGDSDLITPSDSQVWRVMAVNYTNTGGAPMTVNLTLGGMLIQSGLDIPPGQTMIGTIPSNLFSMGDLDLAVVAATGTAAELSTSVAIVLVIQ